MKYPIFPITKKQTINITNTVKSKITSLDKISDEELLKEIHDYQKKCGKAGMIIYDSKKKDKRQCFDGDKAV